MTQEASTSSVLGAFDGRSLSYLGVTARMQRGAHGEYLMTWSSADARWQATVERTVGSHRYQQYLARDRDVYFRLPIAWDVVRQRFIHMNGAFLTPDPPAPAKGASFARADYDRHVTRWNDNCVFCHNVHPNPGLDAASGRFSTQVAELGVACEACHGPGAEHVARNGDPLRRYALSLSQAPDPTITNPARLTPNRSAEICGRCHGQRITSDIARFEAHGDPFVPGEALSAYSTPLTRDTTLNGRAGAFAARFWRDGTPRLTAYEYQGYLLSRCRASNQLTCESCHTMHAGEPSGQLRPSRQGNAACTQCHSQLAQAGKLATHTHHDAAGSGARCIACHMPNIVYGLVSVRLSHRIEVPDPYAAAVAGRPDACTLCHVDRTRRWASAALARDASNVRPAPLSELPEVAERLLAGDPVGRAVAASALGREDARYAAGYRAQLLGALLDAMGDDPYPAVREIAARSLASVLTQHPAEALLRAYQATDARESRLAVLQTVRAALGSDAVSVPPAELRARLRAAAAQTTIEIGE